jgi:hypothetical protein
MFFLLCISYYCYTRVKNKREYFETEETVKGDKLLKLHGLLSLPLHRLQALAKFSTIFNELFSLIFVKTILSHTN